MSLTTGEMSAADLAAVVGTNRNDGFGFGGDGGGGYSYADEDEEKIEMLRDMMQEVSSDEERRMLQKIIRRMEKE